MKKLYTTPLLGLLLLLSGCQFLKPVYVTEVQPRTLFETLNQRTVFLVDVHIPEQKHIKGTVLFVPYNEIEGNLHRFPPDKSTPIYLYCEAGPMGNAAARVLHAHGYQTLYNLAGGTKAWIAAGYDY
jgi:rhodanese-related sulfurtransferase